MERITAKVTPQTLQMARALAEKNGDKQIVVIERAVSVAYKKSFKPTPKAKPDEKS